MSFTGRQPLLDEEHEALLKKELSFYWDKGYQAKDIVNRLGFGQPGPWKDLKKHHVYNYRKKFGLKPRRKRISGQSRYKVKPDKLEPITLDKLFFAMDLKFPIDLKNPMQLRKNQMKRAYLLTHYYSPLRKSEIYERRLDEFSIINVQGYEFIHVSLHRKKKLRPKLSPFRIPMDWRGVKEIQDWLDIRKDRVGVEGLAFPLNEVSAWEVVKELFPDAYPHWFRFKFITDQSMDPEVSIGELRVMTDLHILTLQKYIMTGPRQLTDTTMKWLKRGQPE